MRDPRAVLKGKRNHRQGRTHEQATLHHLTGLGFLEVEKIGTPVSVQRVGGEIVGAQYRQRVSGDIRAICPGTAATAVHAECKSTGNGPGADRLPWNAIKPHQRQALDRRAELGAFAALIWCRPGTVCVLRWPIPGFGPRKSIAWAEALALRIERAPVIDRQAVRA